MSEKRAGEIPRSRYVQFDDMGYQIPSTIPPHGSPDWWAYRAEMLAMSGERYDAIVKPDGNNAEPSFVSGGLPGLGKRRA
jgi:hypothetical protein